MRRNKDIFIVRRLATVLACVLFALMFPDDSAAKETSKEWCTVQTGSYSERDNALQAYDRLVNGLPDRVKEQMRLERVGEYDTLRIGMLSDRKQADHITRRLDELGQKWIILFAPVKQERLVIPPGAASGRQTVRVAPEPDKAAPEPQRERAQTSTPATGMARAAEVLAPERPRSRPSRDIILDTAKRLLDESRDGPSRQRPDWLIKRFLHMSCSALDVTDASLESLEALAREAAEDRGLDLRMQWRGDVWDKEDGHHLDRNRFRLGLIWDIIEDGYLESRRDAADIEDRQRLVRLEANATRMQEQLLCRDVLMSVHFARRRYGPLKELRDIQRLHFDEIVSRYHAGRIFLDKVIKAQADLAETDRRLEVLRRGLRALPPVGPSVANAAAPVLDVDRQALIEGVADTARLDAERMRIKERTLRREHDDIYDLDVEIFADAGADVDRDGVQNDLRAGLNVRIPLQDTDDEKLIATLLREERVKLVKNREDRRLELVRRVDSYQDKLGDALQMNSRNELTRERLRRAVLAHDIRPDPPDPVLGESLGQVAKQTIEHLEARIETLGVKESLYRRLLSMLTRAEVDFEPAMVVQWDPESPANLVRPGRRAVYIWSDTFNAAPNAFILNLLRAKGVTRALVSASRNTDAGKLAEFIAEAPSSGVEVSLLYGVNAWLNPDKRAAALERLERESSVTRRVHLDVEPQALDDYEGNEAAYQDALVQLARQVRDRLGAKTELSLSVTPRISPQTARELARVADRLYVMAYGRTQADSLLRELENFPADQRAKIVLALRPSDFPGELAMENLLRDVAERHDVDSFALHDLESYMKMAGEGDE
ncbi:MAG: hypothetical protein ACOCVM_07630 [Desulfovibrionaceae bacterium]